MSLKYKDKPWFLSIRIGGDDLGKQIDIFVDVDKFDPVKDDDIPRRYNNLDVCVMKKPVVISTKIDINTFEIPQ